MPMRFDFFVILKYQISTVIFAK